MRALSLVSIFMILAGVWLVFMEQVLHHPGYVSRSLVDLGLVLGSLLIMAWVLRRQGAWMRGAAGLYALAALALGAWVLWHLFHGGDVEGFALVIATALCIHAMLVFSSFLRLRPRAQG